MDSIRLALLDDNVLFRETLSRQLAAEPDLQIIEVTSDPNAVIEALSRSHIDVVIIDLNFGGPSGAFTFIPSAARAGYRGKTLVTASYADRKNLLKALRLGVSGIFLLQDSLEHLIKAVRQVAQGNAWLHSGAINLVTEDPPQAPPEPKLKYAMTRREEAVLAGILDGLSNRRIADRMEISEGSVKATVRQLFRKTGARTRTQLVRVALDRQV